MLDEQCKNSDLDALETFLEVWHHLIGDEVTALAAGTKSELLLPRHGSWEGNGRCCSARIRCAIANLSFSSVKKVEDAWNRKEPV